MVELGERSMTYVASRQDLGGVVEQSAQVPGQLPALRKGDDVEGAPTLLRLVLTGPPKPSEDRLDNPYLCVSQLSLICRLRVSTSTGNRSSEHRGICRGCRNDEPNFANPKFAPVRME
jgi:hypothetical protein